MATTASWVSICQGRGQGHGQAPGQHHGEQESHHPQIRDHLDGQLRDVARL